MTKIIDIFFIPNDEEIEIINGRFAIVKGILRVEGRQFLASTGGAGEPMPQGKYKIPFWNDAFTPESEPKFKREGKAYYFFLEPMFHTERSGLLIHPLRDLFTEGCTGIIKDDPKFFDLVSDFIIKKYQVFYHHT